MVSMATLRRPSDERFDRLLLYEAGDLLVAQSPLSQRLLAAFARTGTAADDLRRRTAEPRGRRRLRRAVHLDEGLPRLQMGVNRRLVQIEHGLHAIVVAIEE